LLEGVPLPKMAVVAQEFPRPRLDEIEAVLKAKLRVGEYFSTVKPGSEIAIAVGSRGISNLGAIVRTIVDELKARKARPFIVPAMGSHAGATAEGQKAMLEGLGISAEKMGAEIRATMEAVQLGVSPLGLPVYLDANAASADGIVVVNRIKPHVCFRGPYESGLMKMITIGLGKQVGADFCHRLGFEKMAAHIPDIGRTTIAKATILCGVGIIENAYHETAEISCMRGDEISEKEPGLLEEARKLCSRLYFDTLDVLIIDEIGKDISGSGFDTNIVGRYHSPCISGGPRINRIGILDISEKSKGNGNGLGMADFISQSARDKFDFEQTYPNTLTATLTGAVKIPMTLANDRLVMQACIKVAGLEDMSKVRMVRIRNTLSLGEILVSESLLGEVEGHPYIKVQGAAENIKFTEKGDLF
ncbi:MAG: lactate racemase domain-containing protein, partial [Spirochaetia bacterium]|nr:lactate racemase domain-containing protein [Spirochaetia bacterium]